MAKRKSFRFKDIHGFLQALFGEDVHAKRVYSLANATLGVMTNVSLAIHIIGHGLAQARGLVSKHAIKQGDRLLSNQGIVEWDMFAYWVPHMVAERKAIVVAMDWTDFDADAQTTIALSLVTRHGRTTPLIWLTISKDELKHNRNAYEDQVLARLSQVLNPEVKVTILADRGFGEHKLFNSVTKSTSSGRGQSAKALPVARLSGTPTFELSPQSRTRSKTNESLSQAIT